MVYWNLSLSIYIFPYGDIWDQTNGREEEEGWQTSFMIDIMLFLLLHYITLNVKEIITVVYVHELVYCVFWVYDCFDFMIKTQIDNLSYL